MEMDARVKPGMTERSKGGEGINLDVLISPLRDQGVGMAYDYDCLVLGSGPAGQRAAIQAAKLGKKTLIVERQAVVGGVCTNTGTIPSKTLREAVLHLSGHRERGIYGASYQVKQNITMADLHFRTEHVIRHEIDVT